MANDDTDKTAGTDSGEPGGDDKDKNKDKSSSGDTTTSSTDKSSGDTTSKDDTGSKDKDDDKGGDDNWEDRFKGLQPKYQQAVETYKTDKEAWDKDRINLLGQVSESETKLKSAQDEVKKLTEDAETSGTGKTEMQTQIDTLGKQLERNTLIMSEYPDLSLFEAKGMLPKDVEGEELKTALNEFRTLMGSAAIDALKDRDAGDTGDQDVSTGSRSQGKDIGSLQELLMKANAEGDAKEIKRVTDLLVEAQNKVFAAKQ